MESNHKKQVGRPKGTCRIWNESRMAEVKEHYLSGLNLRQIGEKYGVTREMIRQKIGKEPWYVRGGIGRWNPLRKNIPNRPCLFCKKDLPRKKLYNPKNNFCSKLCWQKSCWAKHGCSTYEEWENWRREDARVKAGEYYLIYSKDPDWRKKTYKKSREYQIEYHKRHKAPIYVEKLVTELKQELLGGPTA